MRSLILWFYKRETKVVNLGRLQIPPGKRDPMQPEQDTKMCMGLVGSILVDGKSGKFPI